MKAGELNRRITIQQKTVTKDSEGLPQETWSDLATVWAAIEPLSGREYFQAAAINAEITTRVRIRYRKDITSDLRLLYGTRILEIVSAVDQKEEHRELHLMCKEVVGNG